MKKKKEENLSIQSQGDDLKIGDFGGDNQTQLLADVTSIQHQNENNFELGQSVDMETISRNRETEDGEIEIGDRIGKLQQNEKKERKKSKVKEGT